MPVQDTEPLEMVAGSGGEEQARFSVTGTGSSSNRSSRGAAVAVVAGAVAVVIGVLVVGGG